MYKVSSDNRIIDLLETVQYVRFLPSGHIAFTDKTSAQGFVGSDGETVYSLIDVGQPSKYSIVTLENILKEEYTILKDKLSTASYIENTDLELTSEKDRMIAKMSLSCKQNIISGFDIDFLENRKYHFELSIEDQLNLRMIKQQIYNNEQSTFVYHAVGHPCEVFSKEDMLKIINQADRHILFHTTYFNVLKFYIESLTEIELVKNIEYGIDLTNVVEVPQQVKEILTQGA